MPAWAPGREQGGGPREGEAGAGSWLAAKATACPSRLTPSCLLGPRQQARGYLPGGRETHLEDMTGPRRKPQHPRGPMTQEQLCSGAWPPRGLGAPLASGPPCPHPPGRPEPWTVSVPPCLSPLGLQTQRSFSLGSKQLASESRSVVSDSLRPGSQVIFSRPEYWRGQLFPLA